ncbi:hypothetical protein ACWCWD_12690 [Streptomyces sp. NPDC001493]
MRPVSTPADYGSEKNHGRADRARSAVGDALGHLSDVDPLG